jgi:hypothetical protein
MTMEDESHARELAKEFVESVEVAKKKMIFL